MRSLRRIPLFPSILYLSENLPTLVYTPTSTRARSALKDLDLYVYHVALNPLPPSPVFSLSLPCYRYWTITIVLIVLYLSCYRVRLLLFQAVSLSGQFLTLLSSTRSSKPTLNITVYLTILTQ